ncbi:hypothetical protein GIB67_023843, partial [Kingdonia uniflora]
HFSPTITPSNFLLNSCKKDTCPSSCHVSLNPQFKYFYKNYNFSKLPTTPVSHHLPHEVSFIFLHHHSPICTFDFFFLSQ